MSELTEASVKEAIKGYVEPHLKCDLVEARAIKKVTIDGGSVNVAVELGFPAKGVEDAIISALKAQIETLDQVTSVLINSLAILSWNSRSSILLGE